MPVEATESVLSPIAAACSSARSWVVRIYSVEVVLGADRTCRRLGDVVSEYDREVLPSFARKCRICYLELQLQLIDIVRLKSLFDRQ